MKKRLFYITVLMLSIATVSNAQMKKGSFEISGNSALQVSSSKVEGAESSTTTVIFNPSVGYFVMDGLSVGLSANVLKSGGSTEYAILPSAKYYFPFDMVFKPYVGLGLGYGGVSGDNDASGFALAAGGGLTYLINSNVGVNLGLEYQRIDYDGAVNNSFGGLVGFSLFF
ncbi:MAG: outer membrane beta-barrel protein [Fermentimonas sp.]|jgi:opacity protein-like surface antigen